MDHYSITKILEKSIAMIQEQNDPDPFKQLRRMFVDMSMEIRAEDHLNFVLGIRTLGIEDVPEDVLIQAHKEYGVLLLKSERTDPDALKRDMPSLALVMDRVGVDVEKEVGVVELPPMMTP